MAPIVVVLVLIALATGVTVLLATLAARRGLKRATDLLRHFSRMGTAHNLSFSCQERFADRVIGLDGIRRKLLILRQTGRRHYHTVVVDLHTVSTCATRTLYSIPAVQHGPGAECIAQVALEFRFRDHRDPVAIPFYEEGSNTRWELPELARKAKDWEIILSKMISPQPVGGTPTPGATGRP